MRHPFHAICPYFAMFPEAFVKQQLLTFTSPGDLVFDPFCGRGTTVFESLLNDRPSAGTDVNRVAACVASAKAAAPTLEQVLTRVVFLERAYAKEHHLSVHAPTPFFASCFESETLSEILFLRRRLRWRSSAADCFIAAMMLGALHGESHKSELYLSNRMPRTISTKPDYSVRWWRERGLVAPRRPTFDVLKKLAAFRFRLPPAQIQGTVRLADARVAGKAFPELAGKVRLVVTSPPYLDTTDYAEDQWLRLWFLGGAPKPRRGRSPDDRLTNVTEYWTFLRESWQGLRDLLSEQATIVVRIGGAKLPKTALRDGLTETLTSALSLRFKVEAMHKGVTSTITARETTAFRPSSELANVEHDFAFELRPTRARARKVEASRRTANVKARAPRKKNPKRASRQSGG